ncbi:N-acetyltransferase [Dictyobacter alpinus]|uniref:N-acetyltransferase n=1 Tax=Dictyobacter alpinus TaxID=2014873 RepID=A0A402B0A4_9CHLR|nr:GNAT family N-acetyltransferase [Dictyobacter alpinus]GCE24791.1 N-acetyltransferase [Dictyobacter alpinus]
MAHEWKRDNYIISTDKKRLDIEVIHNFLTTSYWSPGIPRETIERALEHSLAFGLYAGDQQIGLARLITDYATFAYLADVFVLDAFRGQGLGKWLIQVVTNHPELQGLRRWVLFTKDAHGLYEQANFTPARYPERLMEKLDVDIYTRSVRQEKE